MRIIIAPDSFKGSIGAAAAAAALADGWRGARPGDEIGCLPLADGGEGTLDVLAGAGLAARWHAATVRGPARQPVASCWLELPGRTAVIELARASGLPLLASPDPLGAHTAGAGELISRALDAGTVRVIIALGGSASTDGGTGALSALGARFLDAAGNPLAAGGGALTWLASADLGGLRPPPPGGVTCLADVTAPLLGPFGAAAVFGPQKGAGPRQVVALEAGLARLARLLGGEPTAPGAGAAGGAGYGFSAAWGAAIVPGAAELGRIVGLDATLAGADLVITGEGRYDRTSTAGKVAGAVLAAAGVAGVPVALVAGSIAAGSIAAGSIAAGLPIGRWQRAVSLTDLAGSSAAAQQDPARWLGQAGRLLAADWA